VSDHAHERGFSVLEQEVVDGVADREEG
jgi:hypothetical protein